MTTINNNLTIEQMREIVSKAPANAESYQGGYYFRESPQFMFHNGFHDQWNLTDNDGLYFRAAGFHPVRIDDLRTTIATATQSDAIAKHDSRAFKVGDLVVFDTTKEFCAKLPDDLMEFRVRKDIDAIVTQGSRWFAVSFVAIRHATPSEIKAGHRIDDTTDHVTTQLCIGCGSPDLHKGGEIKEPKMCLDCFAEMVGFTRTGNGFVESDEVTDIRNHISPNTRVVDL